MDRAAAKTHGMRPARRSRIQLAALAQRSRSGQVLTRAEQLGYLTDVAQAAQHRSRLILDVEPTSA